MDIFRTFASFTLGLLSHLGFSDYVRMNRAAAFTATYGSTSANAAERFRQASRRQTGFAAGSLSGRNIEMVKG
jgi:hypothetical protein